MTTFHQPKPNTVKQLPPICKKDMFRSYPDELASTRDELVWYVPHHPVINPDKPDKVGRVCNAASKFRGYSLNDMLLAGPDLLASLMGILSRFRENKFAMTADIEEIFLQVEVKPEDRKFLQFLFFDENHQVVNYQLIGHIFGVSLSYLQHVQILHFNDALWIMHLYSSVRVESLRIIFIWTIC